MDPTPLSTITAWAGGSLLQGDPSSRVATVCTDSRTLKAGDLFLALRGGNFDGHAFVKQAAEIGAAGAVVDHAPEGLPEKFAVIQVPDTLLALQRIATGYRRTLPLKAVVITGSNGKTSTKDFTAAVLGERFRVIKTEGNLNNHIGLPLMILRATTQDQIGVFEIGMNHPGEIAPLAKIAHPDVGVITNIGMAHIEFMGTRDAIAQEKGMLAEETPATGCVILNADDPYTPSIAARTNAAKILCGIGLGDVRASDVRIEDGGSSFDLAVGEDSVRARIGVPGEHMVRNALLAAAVGIFFGLTVAECAAGMENVHLTKGRLEQKMIGGIRIIDDSYNANPDSVIAALRTLSQMPAAGRRIAVLGRMGELGAESEHGHRQVGEAAGRFGIACVISVGEGDAALISESAKRHGVDKIHHVGSTSGAAELLRDLAREGDVVLIKGSRSARMEKILEGLATL